MKMSQVLKELKVVKGRTGVVEELLDQPFVNIDVDFDQSDYIDYFVDYDQYNGHLYVMLSDDVYGFLYHYVFIRDKGTYDEEWRGLYYGVVGDLLFHDVEFEFECRDDKWYLCSVIPHRDFSEDEEEEEVVDE